MKVDAVPVFRRAMRRVLTALAASTLAAVAATSAAQAPAAWPDRPLRLVVGFPAGGVTDVLARVLAERMGKGLGHPVVVENRPGAAGNIAAEQVARAAPDGYSLLLGTNASHATNPFLYRNVSFDPIRDFTAIGMVATITNVLVVTPGIPVRSAPEFVRYARVRADELNYASLGIGSASHLAGEVFTRAVGVRAVHVPFRRLSDTFVEMSYGAVHYGVLTLPAVVGPVREGRLRVLAVMTRGRSAALPEVPAIAEAGLPEAQIDRWSGIVAPRGTPQRIVEQLHGDIVRGLRRTALREQFVRQGAESTPESTPDGFMRLMQEEYLRYRALIREAGIRLEW